MLTHPEAAAPRADGRLLMLAVTNGVPGSFDRLAAQYQSYIARQVRRYVRDRVAAEDLTQEVLLRVYRARARYQPTAHFEAFLRRIIVNLCVNHSRYTGRRRAASLDDIGADGNRLGDALADDTAVSPASEAVRRERAVLVRDAVERLPANQRKVIVLAGFEGLGNAEVAQSTGHSNAAVKSLLFRGRVNLAKLLGPAIDGSGIASSRRAVLA